MAILQAKTILAKYITEFKLAPQTKFEELDEHVPFFTGWKSGGVWGSCGKFGAEGE
jgi:hypothetical protein